MKNKSNLNFVIDALMFIVMTAIGGIGFLMKFILVPGSQRWVKYGENVDLLLWGWDRHQWGTLHLILGFILFGLLFLHIVFHWKQIKCLFANLIPPKAWRAVLTILFILLSTVFLLFAFVVDFEVVPPVRGARGQRLELSRLADMESSMKNQKRGAPAVSDLRTVHRQKERRPVGSVEVNGSMTLQEIENRYDIPAAILKKFLRIPPNVADSERVGRLRRMYGFRMRDVERFIEKYHQAGLHGGSGRRKQANRKADK